MVDVEGGLKVRGRLGLLKLVLRLARVHATLEQLRAQGPNCLRRYRGYLGEQLCAGHVPVAPAVYDNGAVLIPGDPTACHTLPQPFAEATVTRTQLVQRAITPLLNLRHYGCVGSGIGRPTSPARLRVLVTHGCSLVPIVCSYRVCV